MNKKLITVILAVAAIACIAWSVSFKASGLGWFPGFAVAVFLGVKIMDVNKIGQEQKDTRS